MCLYPYPISEELTAKEDIIVYKIITKDNKSYIHKFQYEPNRLYRLRKKLKVEHCEIHKGFHAYLLEKKCITSDFVKLVKFIVPKGAKYYLGMNADIVSSSIRSGNLNALSP